MKILYGAAKALEMVTSLVRRAMAVAFRQHNIDVDFLFSGRMRITFSGGKNLQLSNSSWTHLYSEEGKVKLPKTVIKNSMWRSLAK